MLNVNVFYCFFYILCCNDLTFLFVVPRNWSSTICTELERCCRLRGSGTRGRDWHDRSNGVFGRGRGFPKPCGIWRKDYGHGAALHVFAFFFAFWRLVQRSHPQEIQLNLTAPQGVLNVKRFVPGLNSRLKSNRQIPSLAACSSLSGWIKRCVNAVNGFVFLMAFGWFWAFNVSMALSFSLHFQTWSWIPCKGWPIWAWWRLQDGMLSLWSVPDMLKLCTAFGFHGMWVAKWMLTLAERRLKHSEPCLKMLPKQCGDSWFGQSCDHFARRGFMTISQFHRIPSVFNAGSSVAAFGWKLRLVPVELGLAPVRRESWTDRSQLMSI